MSNTINPVVLPVAWAIKKFSQTKLVNHAKLQERNNVRKYIDAVGVASIILKDGLGCYLYVTQSLNNKEIPDDKRRFVASLDLTNGLLMIALQILMFKTVSNKVVQTKMFNKFFGKIYDRPMQKMLNYFTKRDSTFGGTDAIERSETFKNLRNFSRDAFGGVTSLVAASIIGKRVLVPFIATPLAGVVEKQMLKREAAKNGTAPETSPQDDKTSNPPMQGKLDVVSTADPSKDGFTNLLDVYKRQNS